MWSEYSLPQSTTMEVLTQVIYLLRQLAALIWALSHLINLFKDLFYRLGRIFTPSKRPSNKQPLPDLRNLPKSGTSPGYAHTLKGKVSHSYRTDPRNRQLQQQLMVLLHNDTTTAKRLLKRQRQLQPGKTDNWYLEKVIYDLERDRHC